MRTTERNERSEVTVVAHTAPGVVWLHTRVDRDVGGAVCVSGVLPDGTVVARFSVEPDKYNDGVRAAVETHVAMEYALPIAGRIRLIAG